MNLDEKENYSQDDQNFPESYRESEKEEYQLSPLEDSDSKNYGQDNNRDFTNQGDYEKDDLSANDLEEDDLEEDDFEDDEDEDDLKAIDEDDDEDSELDSDNDYSESDINKSL